ncbi:Hypothetical predicted protein [Cloeon dipterum]|uniref:Uncharacterized protein n=1 Tax=Cloeon dipterum TaxID=197152 RepID=A0A8S1E8U7_9INSE|nr:Hypothetical predicted protein [Cloeon dipterum]
MKLETFTLNWWELYESQSCQPREGQALTERPPRALLKTQAVNMLVEVNRKVLLSKNRCEKVVFESQDNHFVKLRL